MFILWPIKRINEQERGERIMPQFLRKHPRLRDGSESFDGERI